MSKELMATAPERRPPTIDYDRLERILIAGDLASLTPEERVAYNKAVCESVGLNHLTNPFEYIWLNGKLKLYAKRDATDQLRRIHNVSIELCEPKIERDINILFIKANAMMPNGRHDASTGAVSLKGVQGEALANLFMKAETKAKRRATLSICGLGLLDESEVESIPGAKIEPMRPVEAIKERPQIAQAPPEIIKKPNNPLKETWEPPVDGDLEKKINKKQYQRLIDLAKHVGWSGPDLLHTRMRLYPQHEHWLEVTQGELIEIWAACKACLDEGPPDVV